MSTCTHQTMTNHHAPSILAQLGETLHIWRQRYQTRRELAQWTDRDLHDVGLTHSDIAYEVEKPFWRA
jgi:uncharacterized protein YjiS (DUF1127 family)